MEWPPEFYAQLDGSACSLCEQGRPEETYADDPRPGWPFPFPEQDPPPMPEARLRADIEALRRATR